MKPAHRCTAHFGMTRVLPGWMAEPLMPLARCKAATLVLFREAIEERESPFFTV